MSASQRDAIEAVSDAKAEEKAIPVEKLEDITNCVLTGRPMRHPVATSDGCTYELEALLDWFKKSGKTNSPQNPEQSITYFLSLSLEQTLDALEKAKFIKDRYHKYDKQAVIKQIEAIYAAKAAGSSEIKEEPGKKAKKEIKEEIKPAPAAMPRQVEVIPDDYQVVHDVDDVMIFDRLLAERILAQNNDMPAFEERDVAEYQPIPPINLPANNPLRDVAVSMTPARLIKILALAGAVNDAFSAPLNIDRGVEVVMGMIFANSAINQVSHGFPSLLSSFAELTINARQRIQEIKEMKPTPLAPLNELVFGNVSAFAVNASASIGNASSFFSAVRRTLSRGFSGCLRNDPVRMFRDVGDEKYHVINIRRPSP